MARRSEAIDILKLYSQGNYQQWNMFLHNARVQQDISGLADVLRRLQMGMNNLVIQKLNTDKVGELFLRLQRSIENTIREIHREKNPANGLLDKRMKRNELELYFQKSRF